MATGGRFQQRVYVLFCGSRRLDFRKGIDFISNDVTANLVLMLMFQEGSFSRGEYVFCSVGLAG